MGRGGTPVTLQEWTAEVSAALGLDIELDIDLLLDVARDAAHTIARPAAPLTTVLVGVAGGTPDDVRAAAATVQALVAQHQKPE